MRSYGYHRHGDEKMNNETEQESLEDEMRNVVEEARMVIPGIQALFGFQTMAVFNNRFEQLPYSGIIAYLIGLGLLAWAIALLMAPAAYHRLAERGQVSKKMINLSSRLITAGMVPLMLGLAIDIYVVMLAALEDEKISLYCGALALCIFSLLWFIFPIKMRKKVSSGRDLHKSV
jgi:uncharacterized membrane protein